MTGATSPGTYRTRTGRVLTTDADIRAHRRGDRDRRTDLAGAKILYPPDAPLTARRAAIRSPRSP